MDHRTKHVNDLALYRERIGLTQMHVAHLLGIRSTTPLSKLEQGRGLPNLRTALKLAAIYRVPVDFLFSSLYKDLRQEVRRKESQLAPPNQKK